MNYENFFKDLFESIPDFRKVVLLLHLIQNDDDLLKECGILKSDIIRLRKVDKTILIEEIEEHLDYINNEQESVFEIFSNK